MSTNHLGSLVERVAEGLVALDRRGRCTYVSRQTESFLGMSAKEVLGKSLWEEVPGLRSSRLAEEWQLAMDEQRPRAVELSDLAPGRWFEIRLFPAPDGMTIHFADATERKHQEEELRQSAQVYSRLLNTLGGIVWVGEGDAFRFLFVSGKAEEILGYPVRQWLEEPDFWQKRLHPDDVERVLEFCFEARERAEDHSIEYRMIAADGRVIWFRDVVTVENHEAGHVRFRGIMLEITEQKLLMRQRERLWKDFQERVKEYSALASTAYLVQRTDWELKSIVREIVSLLPPAFQYPEVAAARVTVDGVEAVSPGFRETSARLHIDCRCSSGASCGVEVVYLEARPAAKIGPFLAEEQLLLQSIADMLRLAYDQRTARETLARREEQFRTMVENAWDGITIVSFDGTILYQSPSVERVLGYAPEELMGRKQIEFVEPKDYENGRRFIQKVFARGGAPTRFECRCRGRDGSWHVVEVIGRRIAGDNGEPAVLLNSRDITDRSEMERQLRESETRFRRIFEGSGAAMTISDIDYRYLQVNHAFCALLGYSEDELLRLTMRDVTHPEDWPKNEAATDAARAGSKAAVEFEKRYVRKDGSIVWAHTTAVYLFDHEQPVFCVAVIQDITARKQAEEELRRKDRFYRSLIEYSSDNITVLSSDAVTQFQSPAVERQLGYTPQELVGRKNSDLIHPEDLPKAVEKFAEILHTEEVSDPFELRYRHKNGSWRVLESIGRRFVDDAGQIFAILNARDVTERTIAAELLQRAKQQAEAASAAKDRFLAALSHELRTPLTPVVALLPALLEAPGVPEPVRSDLRMIKQNVDLETRLIDDLLDLTHITRGKVQLNREKLDVHQLVEQSLNIVRSDAECKRVVVHVELGAKHHHVWMDRVRTQQVLWNLLKNAIKFSPVGGNVWVRSFNTRPGTVEITVRDEGIGIESELLPRIFDAFVQRPSGDGHQFGGLGLGLFISRAMVEQQGGTLQVESEGRGKGALFCVNLLTITEAMESTADNFLPQRVHPRRPLRILLVEDHSDTREVLARLLRRQGHTVLEAQGVHEAQEVAAQHGLDIMISDLGLPDGNGFDLMIKLKNDYGLRGIAVSGYGMEADFERTHAAGFGAHLVKPIDFGQLQDALQVVAFRLENEKSDKP